MERPLFRQKDITSSSSSRLMCRLGLLQRSMWGGWYMKSIRTESLPFKRFAEEQWTSVPLCQSDLGAPVFACELAIKGRSRLGNGPRAGKEYSSDRHNISVCSRLRVTRTPPARDPCPLPERARHSLALPDVPIVAAFLPFASCWGRTGSGRTKKQKKPRISGVSVSGNGRSWGKRSLAPPHVNRPRLHGHASRMPSGHVCFFCRIYL